jgi:hypothetical protein
LEQRQQEIFDYVFDGGDVAVAGRPNYRSDAVAVARSAMRRWKFGLELDDVIAEALVRMLRRVGNDPSPIGNIGGYFRLTCRSVCTDIANGNSRLPTVSAGETIAEIAEITESVPDGPTADEVADLLTRLRALTELLGTEALAVSGVLTWITLEADDDIDLTGVPIPKGGVSAAERMRWPALWFATGQDALFRSPTATRRRRQRMITKIVDLRTVVIAAARSERS